MNEWPQPKVTAEFHDWSSDWTSLLLVSSEPKNWNPCEKEAVGGVYPTGGSALLQAEHGKGRIVLCQLNLDQACSAIPAEAVEDMEVSKLAPRLLADTLLTNLGLTPAKPTVGAKSRLTRRESIWAMKRLGGNEKAYPSAWQIIGPFPNPHNKNFETVQGPQQDILAGKAPASSYPGDKGEPISWSTVAPAGHLNGYVDLDRMFGRPDWVTAYATMTIKSPTARKVVFFIASDDGFRLWLNGKLIGELDMARGSTPMSEIFRVDLRQGDNVVLLKVTEHVGDHNFYFSMMDENGAALEDCITVPRAP